MVGSNDRPASDRVCTQSSSAAIAVAINPMRWMLPLRGIIVLSVYRRVRFRRLDLEEALIGRLNFFEGLAWRESHLCDAPAEHPADDLTTDQLMDGVATGLRDVGVERDKQFIRRRLGSGRFRGRVGARCARDRQGTR